MRLNQLLHLLLLGINRFLSIKIIIYGVSENKYYFYLPEKLNNLAVKDTLKSWFTSGLTVDSVLYYPSTMQMDDMSQLYLVLPSSVSNTIGKFNPHIPLDLNLINYKNKYEFTYFDLNEFPAGTRNIIFNLYRIYQGGNNNRKIIRIYYD